MYLCCFSLIYASPVITDPSRARLADVKRLWSWAKQKQNSNVNPPPSPSSSSSSATFPASSGVPFHSALTSSAATPWLVAWILPLHYWLWNTSRGGQKDYKLVVFPMAEFWWSVLQRRLLWIDAQHRANTHLHPHFYYRHRYTCLQISRNLLRTRKGLQGMSTRLSLSLYPSLLMDVSRREPGAPEAEDQKRRVQATREPDYSLVLHFLRCHSST